MKKEVMAFAVFAFLLVFSIVSAETAYKASVSVQAEPEKNIVIIFKNLEADKNIRSILLETSSSGHSQTEIETELEEVGVEIVYISDPAAFLKPENIVSRKEVGVFATNKAIIINLQTSSFNRIRPPESEIAPATVETAIANKTAPAVNETTEEAPAPAEDTEEVLTENTEEIIKESESDDETGSGITGMAILKGETTGSKIFYGAVIAVFLSGLILFFIMRRSHHAQSSSSPSVVKLSEMNRQTESQKLSSAEKKLADAEEELRQAKSELNEIRNKKSKIEEAEKAFEDARRNLENLRNQQGWE